MFEKLVECKEAIEVSKNLVSIAAIIVAGFWTWMIFISKREHKPKADIEIEATQFPLDNGKIVLRFNVTIKNEGQTALNTDYIEVTLAQIKPLPQEVKKMSEKENTDIVFQGMNEVAWPKLAGREWTNSILIEPGESNQISTSFIVAANTEISELYVFVKNPKNGYNKKDQRFGWSEKKTIQINRK